ncbi:MAG TPA: hypothetical protein DCY93_02125 [Firmicutes bacterium]|nr:hypothetical protein [Bacillota bacterium]
MIKYARLGIGLIPHLTKASFWIGKYAKHKDKYPLEKRYNKTRHLIHIAFDHFRTDLYIDGEENIPSVNSLIVPNHQSLMDPVILIHYFSKPITFVAKEETKKFPWFGKLITCIDGVFIERDNLRQEIRIIRQVTESLQNEDKSWVIFPEGTRSKDKDMKMSEFKAGSFKPALSSKAPILPVAIFGTHRILDQKLHRKRYPVQISFLKPIEYEEYKDLSTIDISKLVQDKIAERLEQLKEKDKELLKNKKKKK